VDPDVQEVPIPDLCTARGQEAIATVIGEAELIVVDNLSAWARSGVENEGESWLPIAGWALRMRREGRWVLFVHLAGKNGAQRGTSRREDLLDVVLKLKHPADYRAEEGARFEIHFEKARRLFGEAVRSLEATLTRDESGHPVWRHRMAEGAAAASVLQLRRDGLSAAEIATELGVNRSTVYRRSRRPRRAGRRCGGRRGPFIGTECRIGIGALSERSMLQTAFEAAEESTPPPRHPATPPPGFAGRPTVVPIWDYNAPCVSSRFEP
jgi:hypothetical protein